MPSFSYKAKSSKGETKKGILEAKNEHELAKVLRGQGFILISAENVSLAEAGKKRFSISLPFWGRVSLIEKMMFTRNLRVMVSAGIPLPRSLETLSEQTKNKKFKTALLEVRDEITKGKNFSESLDEHPLLFTEFFTSMIKVGEEGGKLEEVLGILARQMEREHELSSKIKGALIYPAVIISAMIGIGVLMLIMVVPKLSTTFKELNVPLPSTTRFIIWIGETLASKWYLVFGLILFLLFLFWQALKIKKVKEVMDGLSLKIPIISSIIKKTNCAYTARSLSSLIASGVPIARSLEILSGVLGNVYYKKAMEVAAERIRKGGTLSATLADYKNIYPLLIIQMVAVGEETGQTSEILDKLSDFLEEEVANATKNLAAIIEPLVMLLVGGAVGFFAISMIQPMYSMLGAIR